MVEMNIKVAMQKAFREYNDEQLFTLGIFCNFNISVWLLGNL